jgi:hypothetical protein
MNTLSLSLSIECIHTMTTIIVTRGGLLNAIRGKKIPEIIKYLEKEYPEATWNVSREPGKININPTFENEKDKTFFLLRFKE